MTEGRSYSTSANCHMTKHVTSEGPKSAFLLSNEIMLVSSFQISYLHHLLPQRDTYCNTILFYYFGVLSFKVTYLQQ